MKLVKEHIILEKFTEDSDPIRDLGIGMIRRIQMWLKEHNISERDYTLNDDLTINLLVDTKIINEYLIQFPDFIQFKIAEGSFYCYSNKLISLRGCPEIVNRDFNCADNLLETLEGGPRIVKGKYYCHMNQKLTSLKGCPEIVGTHFDCDQCNITTLEYMPKQIGGHFLIYPNPKKFIEKEIRQRCDIKQEVIINRNDQ